MKTILLLSLVLIFNIVACDDSGNSGPQCTFEEYREMVANTECLAEELLVACNGFVGCRRINPDSQASFIQQCDVVDCETLSCPVVFGLSSDSGPVFLSELAIDEITGLPIGIFQVDDLEGDFTCDIIFTP